MPSAPPPNPSERTPGVGRLALAGLLFWTLLGLILGINQNLVAPPQGVAFWTAVRNQTLAGWLPHALDTVVLFLAARRLPLHPGRRLRHGLLLGLILTGVAAVNLLFQAGVELWLYPAGMRKSPAFDQGFLAIYVLVLQRNFFWTLAFDGGIAGVAYAFASAWRLRQRESEAAELRRELVEAQLQTLKMQMQPHFLFNTLHAIGVTTRRDPEEANRMVSLLGDLLRLSLQTGETQVVPLRTELEFLRPYLEIQRIRFQDRLQISVQIPSETLDLPVPSLVLQPLVENAIRHGVEARSGQGKVAISARRDGPMLVLEVRDDGIGLGNGHDGTNREGVGLGNTRARLEKLYGPRQELRLMPGESGGARVVLRVPATDPDPDRNDARGQEDQRPDRR